MFCKKCGTENLDSVKFCKSCGSMVGSSQIEDLIYKKSKQHFRNKRIAISLFLLVAVLSGSLVVYSQYEKKRELTRLAIIKEDERNMNLDLNYLKEVHREYYLTVREDEPKTEAQIDEFLDNLGRYNKKIKVASSYFYDYAKEASLDDDAKKKYFLSMIMLLKPSWYLSNTSEKENWEKSWQEYSKNHASIIPVDDKYKAKLDNNQLLALSDKSFKVASDSYETFGILSKIDIQNKEECLADITSPPCKIIVDGKNIGTIEVSIIEEIAYKDNPLTEIENMVKAKKN